MILNSLARASAAAAVAVLAASTISIAESTPARADVGWGAIAYSSNGSNGQAWDYPSGASAGQAAVRVCGYTDCDVLTQFMGCGAVARNETVAHGGHGRTLAAAEASALAQLGTGDGYIDAWACN
jgi:hypothetical protein